MSETPHSADWFRSLGTDERVPLAVLKFSQRLNHQNSANLPVGVVGLIKVDTGDVPVQLAVQPQVSLQHVKSVKPVKPALRIPQVRD